MKNYAFLFAMKEEGIEFLNSLDAKLIEDDFFEIYQKDNIYITFSKVGLINASICFAYINSHYKIDIFVNAGLVGTFDDNLKQLEPIIIDKSFLGNADATGFGYKLGQVPGMPQFYESDAELVQKLKDFKKVNICSSDIFINSEEKVKSIIKPFENDIKVFDMECFSFFQSAYVFKKQFIAIKIISDHIGSKSNEEQFKKILTNGSKKISEILLNFIA